MDKLMMQNGFFGHTEGTNKVSAGLKNTKIKIAIKRPISGRIAHYEVATKLSSIIYARGERRKEMRLRILSLTNREKENL